MSPVAVAESAEAPEAANDDESAPTAFERTPAFTHSDAEIAEALSGSEPEQEDAPCSQPQPRWRRIAVATGKAAGLFVAGAGVLAVTAVAVAASARGARGGIVVNGDGKGVDHGVALLAMGIQEIIDATRCG